MISDTATATASAARNAPATIRLRRWRTSRASRRLIGCSSTHAGAGAASGRISRASDGPAVPTTGPTRRRGSSEPGPEQNRADHLKNYRDGAGPGFRDDQHIPRVQGLILRQVSARHGAEVERHDDPVVTQTLDRPGPGARGDIRAGPVGPPDNLHGLRRADAVLRGAPRDGDGLEHRDAPLQRIDSG